MSELPIAARCERDNALTDVQQTCAMYGMPVTVRIRRESDVTRDKLGSVIARQTEYDEFTIGSFPFNTSPNHRELEKAGLREMGEVLAYVASKDFTDRGITFREIDAERTTIIGAGEQYRIVEKNATSAFLDAFLYYTFSLKRM